MRKYIILWVFVFYFSCCLSVDASTGSLDILINENEEFTFTYTKIADYKNGMFVLNEAFEKSGIDLNEITKGGNIRKVAEELGRYEVEKERIKTKNQVAKIGLFLKVFI